MGLLSKVVGSIAGPLIGGLINRSSNNSAGDQNAALQREFAQNGIRWRVEDAKAAGLHPLAALGAQTTSFAPSYVGDTSLGNAVAGMGQDISRAYEATRTGRERLAERAEVARRQARIDAMNEKKHSLDVQRLELENALLAADLAKKQAAPNPPMPDSATAYPIKSAPSVGAVRIEPSTAKSSRPGVPSLEASKGPGFVERRIGGTKFGTTIEVPNEELSQGLESMGPFGWLATPAHSAMRAVDKLLYGNPETKPKDGPGYTWKWDKWQQNWEAVPTSKRR